MIFHNKVLRHWYFVQSELLRIKRAFEKHYNVGNQKVLAVIISRCLQYVVVYIADEEDDRVVKFNLPLKDWMNASNEYLNKLIVLWKEVPAQPVKTGDVDLWF